MVLISNVFVYHVATTVRFSQTRFSVTENRGPAQATLVSDEPFSNEVVINVIASANTAYANGKQLCIKM